MLLLSPPAAHAGGARGVGKFLCDFSFPASFSVALLLLLPWVSAKCCSPGLVTCPQLLGVTLQRTRQQRTSTRKCLSCGPWKRRSILHRRGEASSTDARTPSILWHQAGQPWRWWQQDVTAWSSCPPPSLSGRPSR